MLGPHEKLADASREPIDQRSPEPQLTAREGKCSGLSGVSSKNPQHFETASLPSIELSSELAPGTKKDSRRVPSRGFVRGRVLRGRGSTLCPSDSAIPYRRDARVSVVPLRRNQKP